MPNNFEDICCICIDNKILIKKFACECKCCTCIQCSSLVKKCPLCRSSQFCLLSKIDIIYFYKALLSNNIEKWFIYIIGKNINNVDGIIKINTFYSSIDIINEAKQKLINEIDVDILNLFLISNTSRKYLFSKLIIEL